MIHGDPVFTIILINEYDEIKFIDMRGLVGDKLTIYGDWLYDWYQNISIINRIRSYFIRERNKQRISRIS